MTHAYSELYIENAQKVFGHMLHYVVYDLGMKYDPYCRLFVQSGVADQFGRGNPRFVAGMSGTELADEVLRRVTGHGCDKEPEPYTDRTDAWWTGYTLAWYQWWTSCDFRELFEQVPPSSVAGMYRKYHEMDLQHSADEITAGTCGSLRRPCPDHSAVRTRSKRDPQGSLGDSQPPRSSPALPAGAMCPFFPTLKHVFSIFANIFHLY